MDYISRNLKEFELSNILLWHKLGFTGKGIKIAELEGADTTLSIFNGKLTNPFNYIEGEKENGHGQYVLEIMHQVAPDSDLYILPAETIIDVENNTVSGKFFTQTLPYSIQNGVHIIGASLGGFNLDLVNAEIEKAKQKGVCFVTSAGNKGNRGLSGYAASNVWIAVGAVGYSDETRNIYLKDYSSIGNELDIVSFSGIHSHNADGTETVLPLEGTSFSSPMVVGMCALVQEFFLKKVGRTLYQWELEKFIYDHVKDLGEINKDNYYGHGLFVLPHPDDIDVYKYIGDDNMEIKMKIGSNTFTVDGINKTTDVAPFIKDGRTMVPLRLISELFGADVEYDAKNKIITITK